MAVSVVMPALEMAQETGKLVAWKKKEGDAVSKGEMLLEVETDKAVVEIEAAGDGILSGISAQVGDVVPVGQTIAWLLKPGEALPKETGQQQTGRKMEAPAREAAPSETAPAPAASSVAGVRISPKARRLAREQGVDIDTVQGSGPNGEILADDILKSAKQAPAAARPAAAAASAGADVVTSIGRIMAQRTTESWTHVPHFFLARDVDATALNAARGRLVPLVEKSHGVKLTHTDLFVAAVARTLTRHARVNASWTNDTVALNAEINVALAMAVENAVVTGVIKGADRLPLGAIATRRHELAERARAGKLQPADITGATFTISNLGMFGVDAFTAIIVPPQAGILAVAAIADRVVAVDGMIGVRPMVTLTLSSDHRVVDGARAAQFLDDLAATIAQTNDWAQG